MQHFKKNHSKSKLTSDIILQPFFCALITSTLLIRTEQPQYYLFYCFPFFPVDIHCYEFVIEFNMNQIQYCAILSDVEHFLTLYVCNKAVRLLHIYVVIGTDFYYLLSQYLFGTGDTKGDTVYDCGNIICQSQSFMSTVKLFYNVRSQPLRRTATTGTLTSNGRQRWAQNDERPQKDILGVPLNKKVLPVVGNYTQNP